MKTLFAYRFILFTILMFLNLTLLDYITEYNPELIKAYAAIIFGLSVAYIFRMIE